MTISVHKTDLSNRTQTMRFYPFVFTGKERDEETGYGYFGARYMDHELTTMWLSVDPMADKYPSISPYAYCAWNPVKLVDPEGKEAMENEDWYRNDVGDILWDDKVKRQEDLPDNYTYLGSNGVGVNEGGIVTRVYNEDGTIDVIPQYLPQVDIVANSRSTEVATQMPIALSVALWDGPEIGPTDVVAALSLIYLAGCYTFWKVSEILAAPGEGSCPNQDIRGGHDNNVRKSTKGKHENGDSRSLQDQQGSKGEKMMKGKRPKGYKGPWPPKKKK